MKAGKVPLLIGISCETVAENLVVAVVVTVVVVPEENPELIDELIVVDSLENHFVGEPMLLRWETSVASA